MIWINGHRMKRCRNCGDAFAFKHSAEWYCSSPVCQAAKVRRKSNSTQRARPVICEVPLLDMPPPAPGPRGPQGVAAGVRAAKLDAEAALIELRDWTAHERAKW
jgi:hypothetical protein